MFFFKLIPLPISHKPGIIKEGIKDNGPVFGRKVLQNTPEQSFRRMAWSLKHFSDPINSSQDLMI